MREIPKKIYLQIKNDFGEELHDEEVTWCKERIYKSDVVYIRPPKKEKK